jgi:hypothetical protein
VEQVGTDSRRLDLPIAPVVVVLCGRSVSDMQHCRYRQFEDTDMLRLMIRVYSFVCLLVDVKIETVKTVTKIGITNIGFHIHCQTPVCFQ